MKKRNIYISLLFLFMVAFNHPKTFTQCFYSPVIDSIIARVNTASITNVVRELSGDTSCIIGGNTYTLLTRAYNQPENDLAAQYVFERFQNYGLDASYWQYSSTGKNVIGKRTGVKYPNQKYIICAHYDSYPWGPIAPGADDDASGIAAVLEAAKQLMYYNPDYTLLCIGWDEEERGLYGSRAYADSAYFHGDSIIGVLNFDMIAYDPLNQRNIRIISDTNSVSLANIMNGVVRLYAMDMNPTVDIDINAGGSDEFSFWQRGYKALWPFENPFNPYVNSMMDSIYYFNLKYFTRTSQCAVAAIATLAFDFIINFQHQQLLSSEDTTDRIASVCINSHQEIAAGTNAPLLYYKVGTGPYNPVQYFYNNLDTFKYIIPGQPVGSSVSYYFAAQDRTGLLIATYPAGGRGVDPPGTIPTNVPFVYYILGMETYCSKTVPRDLPPKQATYDSIFIPDERIVSNLDVNLTIYHPYDQDLIIGFTDPEGTLIRLSYGNGGTGANYLNTTFDDEAAVPIKNGTPPFTGSYIPENPLHTFYGKNMQGVWRLRVFNNSTSQTAHLINWCLNGYYYNPIGIVNNQIPVRTSLSQNYPNPFNPNTQINFLLERTNEVKLVIYDILGREVKVLINNRLNDGDYSVDFNGSELSSGIYFYTLFIGGNRFDTKKMVLVK